MEYAINETNRRRKLQLEYNEKHGITPKTIIKKIQDITEQLQTEHKKTVSALLLIDGKSYVKNPEKVIKQKERQMNAAVKILDFETAAIIRDEIKELKNLSTNQKEN
jgi:excinuclease ABC subunit B